MMEVGIGLPNTVPGTEGEQLLEFARRGESAGFASLGTLDRLVYPGLEPLVSLAYFALGPKGKRDAESYLGHYYAALGDEQANQIIASAATDEETVRAYIRAFAEAGCDELLMFPCSADPEQADLLADAALAKV